nr:hypothetical protein TorRG33x02_063700 [Ipomoea batatas]
MTVWKSRAYKSYRLPMIFDIFNEIKLNPYPVTRLAGVTNVESFDGAVQRRLGEVRRIASGEHDGFKLRLAEEQNVEKLPEPGDGKERGVIGGGGRIEVGEAVGDVFLKEFEV